MESKFHVDFNDDVPGLEPIITSAYSSNNSDSDLYHNPDNVPQRRPQRRPSFASDATDSDRTRTPSPSPTRGPRGPQTPPEVQPLPQTGPPDAQAPTSPRHLRTLLVTSLFTTLLPAHIYIAQTASVYALLKAYAFAFVVTMYFLASVILMLGILVPPVMLMHWVWETWNEASSPGGNEAVAEAGREDGA